MSTRSELEATLAALENQRGVLGDAVVDTSIAALREQLVLAKPAELAASERTAERKLVTVMFADISGFTALAEKLDPEQVRSLVNACFTCLVPVVERYGGVVEKFIGDAIMAMFGAPAAHENDPERALRAALDMMEALKDFNAGRGTDLALHFGINTGKVVAGGLGSDRRQQYGVMGDAVNLAARLEDASTTGEILVGPITHSFTASLFDFEVLPPVRVKGKAEPVIVHRLLGLRCNPETLHGIEGLRSPMVGRDAELQLITDSVNNLKHGRGAAIAILAEAGLGKSRLVAEARNATQRVALWVEGRTLSYAEGVSYWIVRNMLDHLVGVTPDASSAQIAASLRVFVERELPETAKDVLPYLARLRDLPAEGPGESIPADVLPEALQERMRSAFGALLCACARRKPLVLVWEDLHWADPSSLGLLESLLPLADGLPILFVLVFRPDEGRTWDWHKQVSARLGERYSTMELSPLNPTESVELISNLLSAGNIPDGMRALLLERSEGNPFFVEELIRSLVDIGVVQRQPHGIVVTQAVADLQVPGTLQAVIAARLDRLPADAKYALQTAAVIGRIFQQVVLGYLLQREHASVALDAALRELQQRELIRWRGQLEYIFKHAITHEVTYNSLLISRRRDLHRATGETIEVLFPTQTDELAPTLAYHFQAAGVPDKAARYFSRAGDRARQTYANSEALALYGAAIDQCGPLGDASQLRELYEKLGDMQSLVGQVDAAIQSYEKALGLTSEENVVGRARLLRRQGNAYNVARRADGMQAAYQRAMEVLGPRTEASMEEWIDLQLDRIWASYFYFNGRMDELMGMLEEARPVIEAQGSLPQKMRLFESMVLIDLRRYRYHQLPDQTLTSVGRATEVAQASGNRRAIGRARTICGFVHLWRGELDEAERFLREGLIDVDAVGDVETKFINLNYMALIGRKRGLPEMARDWAHETLALARKTGNRFYEMTALGSLAWAAYRAGLLPEARAHLEAALPLQEAIPSPIRFMVSGPALALGFDAGDWPAAFAHARTLLHPSQQKMPDKIEATLTRSVERWDAGDAAAACQSLSAAMQLLRDSELGYV